MNGRMGAENVIAIARSFSLLLNESGRDGHKRAQKISDSG
jgi:hypothetical protein